MSKTVKPAQRSIAIACGMLMFISLFIGLVLTVPGVLAAPDNTTWTGLGSGNLGSTAGNWDNGTPTAGSNIWFLSGSKSCTWDVGIAAGDFHMRNGYSGTFSEATWWDCENFDMTGGTYEGSSGSFQVFVRHNFSQTGGTITTATMTVRMDGGYSHISAKDTIWYKLRIDGGTTIDKGTGTDTFTVNDLDVNSGAWFTINGNLTIRVRSTGGGWANDGIIDGSGLLRFELYDSDITPGLGTIWCPMMVDLHPAAAAEHYFYLAQDTELGSSLTVDSQSATKLMIFEMAGYDLDATGITIGSMGRIDTQHGSIIDRGNWNSTYGSWVPGSGTVTFTNPAYVKTGSGQSFYNVIFNGSAMTLSNLNITGDMTLPSGQVLGLGWGDVQKSAANPVFDPAGVETKDPSLLMVDGRYYMAYSNITAGPVVSCGLAYSDDFITWTDMGAVVEGTEVWEQYKSGAPFLFEHDGTFYMFYQGCVDSGENWNIGVATTHDITDPDSWVQNPGNPILTHSLSDSYTYDPSVVELNGTFYMTYISGYGARRGMALATSDDLIGWTKYNSGHQVYTPTAASIHGIEATNIFEVSEGFYLGYMTDWDAADHQITRQIASFDMVHWIDVLDPLITRSAAWELGGTGTETGTSSPSMVRDGDILRIAYQGFDDHWKIGVANATGFYLDWTQLGTDSVWSNDGLVSGMDLYLSDLDSTTTVELGDVWATVHPEGTAGYKISLLDPFNGAVRFTESTILTNATDDWSMKAVADVGAFTLSDLDYNLSAEDDGQMVMSWTIASTQVNQTITYNLTGLPNGMYHVYLDGVQVYSSPATYGSLDFNITGSGDVLVELYDPMTGIGNLLAVYFAIVICIGIVGMMMGLFVFRS